MMSDIQRWKECDLPYSDMAAASDGEWVYYADHVEALRQAVDHRDALHATSNGMAYEQGQRDALAYSAKSGETLVPVTLLHKAVAAALDGAVQRVEAVTGVNQLVDPAWEMVWRRDVIAAIEGESA